MGDVPSSVNKTAVLIDGIIHTSLVDVGLNLEKAAIISIYPWLKIPVLSWFFNFIMGIVANRASKYFEEIATNAVIDHQTGTEKKEYAEAKISLKMAIDSGSQESIDFQKEIFKKKLGSLIHWDGSTP